MIQALLGFPFTIISPSTSHGLGCAMGQFRCQMMQCFINSSSAYQKEPAKPLPTYQLGTSLYSVCHTFSFCEILFRTSMPCQSVITSSVAFTNILLCHFKSSVVNLYFIKPKGKLCRLFFHQFENLTIILKRVELLTIILTILFI